MTITISRRDLIHNHHLDFETEEILGDENAIKETVKILYAIFTDIS